MWKRRGERLDLECGKGEARLVDPRRDSLGRGVVAVLIVAVSVFAATSTFVPVPLTVLLPAATPVLTSSAAILVDFR